MAQQTKHTEGKWIARKITYNYYISSEDGLNTIAQLPLSESDEANAEMIVKAVNNHDKLVEALEYGIKHISRSINATPSGELRNEMTEWNIVAMHLLQSLKD